MLFSRSMENDEALCFNDDGRCCDDDEEDNDEKDDDAGDEDDADEEVLGCGDNMAELEL